jgi:transcriptional regulator with XRE-family HTH domain
LELGLSQEELAERIGGSASQAEVSRLERGAIALPRRRRLEELAAALEVTIGTLLIKSRWLTNEADEQVERVPAGQQHLDASSTQSIVAEIAALRVALLGEIERISSLEATIRGVEEPGRRPDLHVLSRVFDGQEDAVVFGAEGRNALAMSSAGAAR